MKNWFHRLRRQSGIQRRRQDIGGAAACGGVLRVLGCEQLETRRLLTEFSASFPPLNQAAPSATYFNGQTGDNTAATFVQNLYRETLGREPDTGGQTYWINVYAQAATSGTAATAQQTVIAGFLGSSAYREHLVAGIYHDFLHRTADAGGLQFWAGKLAAGEDEKNVLAEIVGSDEYFADAGVTAAGFVGALYSDILGRPAEPQGIVFWTSFIRPPPSPPVGTPQLRTEITLAFLSTPEANQKLLNGNYPAAAGSVGAPGTPAVGGDALGDITGNGWDNLYFQGNLNPVAVDTIFTQLQAGAAYDQAIGGMLDRTQYF